MGLPKKGLNNRWMVQFCVESNQVEAFYKASGKSSMLLSSKIKARFLELLHHLELLKTMKSRKKKKKSHGKRSLAGYSPWVTKSQTTSWNTKAVEQKKQTGSLVKKQN